MSSAGTVFAMDYAQRELATAFRHLGVAGGIPQGAEPMVFNPLTARAIATRDLGLPTLRWRGVHEQADLATLSDLKGPVRIITADGQVSYLDSVTDIVWSGQELLVEALPGDAEEIIILVAKSRDTETGKDVVWFAEPIAVDSADTLETVQPAPLSDKMVETAHSISARIVATMSGQTRGLYWVSVTVSDEQLYFSHLGFGPSPAGLLTAYTQRCSQSVVHARAFLGLPVDITLTSPGAAAVVKPEGEEADLALVLSVPETDAVHVATTHSDGAGEDLWLVVATGPTVEDAARRVTAAVSSFYGVPRPDQTPHPPQ